MLGEYNKIKQEPLQEGILETIPKTPTGSVVHYVSHQAMT